MPAERDHDAIAVDGRNRGFGKADVSPAVLAESADPGLGFSGTADVAHPLLGLIEVRHEEIVRL
jgi:hypothetical protein